MKTDIEIAAEARLKNIADIAAGLKIPDGAVSLYGKYKAKVSVEKLAVRKPGKLILVTAINPTKAGEGKTTMSIGLADALRLTGVSACLALREPSLGPVFGMKGGATGGGYSQVVPMDEINLHFTGDFHAITSANNLLCALIDNHINSGNPLNIDVTRVVFKRCMDMNDRALRNIVIGLGGSTSGAPREDGFEITAASEIMAVLCLSYDLADLKKRLGMIVAAYDRQGKPVTAADLRAADAMAILLKDAIDPNLVQTLSGTPAFIHGGPFANIAHGCNSVRATRAALSVSDYVVTEAGFGADLGAEKFIDIKCRAAGFEIGAVVLVATVRALKLNGEANAGKLKTEDLGALKKGLPNLIKHIRNIRDIYKQPCVVAVNRFDTDTDAEIKTVIAAAAAEGVKAYPAEYFAKGGQGGLMLAEAVKEMLDKPAHKMSFAYGLDDSYIDKISAVAKKVYGAAGVVFSDKALKEIKNIEGNGNAGLPVCIAKTQYSLSDDPLLFGAPEGFTVNIREVKLRRGAGFVVAVAGDMLLMPGLPKVPNAEGMQVTDAGVISGLF